MQSCSRLTAAGYLPISSGRLNPCTPTLTHFRQASRRRRPDRRRCSDGRGRRNGGGPRGGRALVRVGPYLSERAWGTVREDYSDNGDAWSFFFPYEHTVSRSYRWSEDGWRGSVTSGRTSVLDLRSGMERTPTSRSACSGLSGHQGNHGEGRQGVLLVPRRHALTSWLRWRYHYPQGAFPDDLIEDERAQRDRSQPEYELMDTGIFDEDRFWKVDVDYAKDDPTDIYIRVRITNAGPEADTIHVLPQLWFRDTWSWGVGAIAVPRCATCPVPTDPERSSPNTGVQASTTSMRLQDRMVIRPPCSARTKPTTR